MNTPWGTKKERCQKLLICVKCQKPVEKHIHTDAGWAEYKITGLCEDCFDEITGGEDEE
jgi:uncharacterized CHY-type Zn-finger protein